MNAQAPKLKPPTAYQRAALLALHQLDSELSSPSPDHYAQMYAILDRFRGIVALEEDRELEQIFELKKRLEPELPLLA